MSACPSDRNLLYGILALQMDFTTRDALIRGMNAWVLEKHRPLGEILVEQGALRADLHEMLQAMVARHLEVHGHDPQQSLAALRSVGPVRHDLGQIVDPDVQASVALLGTTPAADGLPQAGGISQAAPAVRYRKVRPHARGGLGEVFVAVDEELQREVALKEIQSEHADRGDSRARFLREAHVTARLEHPGIVPVHGLGCYADGRPFYAMRFIRGDNLQDAIGRFHQADRSGRDPGERTLELRQLLRRFVDVCNAVAYAHSRGVIHRDLKPANVLLGQYGETLVVDWGLARPVIARADGTVAEVSLDLASTPEAGLTQAGRFVGTPAFASPEQAAGRLDELGPASDVYSLGAMLYGLLTGQAPFAPAALEVVLQRVQRGEFPRPRQVKGSVPAALEAVCLKAMALKPAGRYSTARALAEDVERWLADEPVSAWREPLAVKAGRWVRKNRVLATSSGVAVVVALLLGTVGAVFWQQQRQRAREQALAGLAQAARLRKDCRFDDARAMLKQVDGWARQAADRQLQQRLADSVADLELARDLDAVRQKGATLVDGKWRLDRMCAEYPDVLAGHGLRLLEGDLAELAPTIRASTVRESIVAALDDWALAETNQQKKQHLLKLANLADEPDPWRQGVRQAVARRDGKRLKQLLRKTTQGKPTSGVVLLLARAFGVKNEEPTALLRQMQREQPHAFWVNFELGLRLHEAKKPQEAAACFLVAVVLRPDSAPAHNNLGVVLEAKGKVEEAIACYHKALAIDPKNAKAHTNLGVALYAKGKLEEAIACYQKAISLDPKDTFAHSNLGNAMRAKGKVEEAIRCYDKALALDPRNAVAHSNLGSALRARGKVDEAIACLRQAITLDPSYANAHNNLGSALYARGKVDEAIACWKQAISLDPTDATGHTNLGIALQGKGKVEEAIAYYHKALALTPKDATAHINLGSALQAKGKVDDAIACWKEAIALDPRAAKPHNNLGLALRAKGKVDQAVACFRRAITLDPKDADAHTNLGNALAVQGKMKDAITCWKEAISLDPKNARAHTNLGTALQDQGKVDEAIAHHRKALALDPRNAVAHSNLGSALRARGKVDEAIACLRQAITLDPSYANAHNNLGNALYARGKVDEAIACWKRAISLDPKLAQPYGVLGQALMQQGKFSEAKQSLRRCLALLPPDHSLRPLALRLVRQCQEWLDTDAMLNAYLTGQVAPLDAASQVQMAALAQQPFRRLYLTATRLYRDAFVRQPDLADAHRYNAACTAALAAAGQAEDGRLLPDKVTRMLRRQALGWLKAELARWARQVEQGDVGPSRVARILSPWKKDPSLASLRDPEALAGLDADERQQWGNFWQEVQVLLARNKR